MLIVGLVLLVVDLVVGEDVCAWIGFVYVSVWVLMLLFCLLVWV